MNSFDDVRQDRRGVASRIIAEQEERHDGDHFKVDPLQSLENIAPIKIRIYTCGLRGLI